MKKLLIVFTFSLLLVACKKEAEEEPQQETEMYSEASYQITVTGKWNATDFNVPPGVHFTQIAGAVHNKEVDLWKEGMPASRSVEYIAENGYSAPLLADVDTLIMMKKALSRITAQTPPPTGSSTFGVKVNTNFFRLSFASMLAPTPDWFFGASGFALYRNGSWVRDTTVQLFAYDGGTEEGDVFSGNNPDTNPQQPIHLLSIANASRLFKGSVLPIAEMRIQKLE